MTTPTDEYRIQVWLPAPHTPPAGLAGRWEKVAPGLWAVYRSAEADYPHLRRYLPNEVLDGEETDPQVLLQLLRTAALLQLKAELKEAGSREKGVSIEACPASLLRVHQAESGTVPETSSSPVTLAGLVAELRSGDLHYDPWGTAMGAFFAVAAELQWRGTDIPAKWQYTPGCAADQREPDGDWFALLEAADEEVLLSFGEMLHRYTDLLRRDGKDY